MNVIAWSQSLTKEKAEELGIGYCECPEKVAEQADAISIHLIAKPETKHFIGKDFLNRMKNGAILINTSRGEVVDTAALKEAIKEKELRVGLDVFENEPSGGEDSFEDTELAGIVSCTPHIGASTLSSLSIQEAATPPSKIAFSISSILIPAFLSSSSTPARTPMRL